MNGRLYDAELGRMLSADPYVQVPEYSQNFNRYSYVLNNPLNKTDPTGYSWLSKAFHKIGAWVKENWRTIASIVFAVVAFFILGPGAFGFAGMNLLGSVGITSGWAVGASIGAVTGAFNAAINGGNILQGALIGAVQGGIAGGVLHGLEEAAGVATGIDKAVAIGKHVVGHGVVGGAANEAMGGKFQDGFLSAAASAAAVHTGLTSTARGSSGEAIGMAGRTAASAIIGGTASALGGGKFANGAYTAAFQHLLNHEAVAKAESSFEIERAIPVETDDPMFDERTNKMLNSLHPEVKRLAHRHIYQLKRLGIDARIISGNRTYKEQDYIYAQGRTRPGKIVTNARGGYSNHNFGIAYDIGIFGNGGKVYLTADSVYKTPGIIGEKIGLEWGGRWKSPYDPPHFQYRTGLNVRQLRELVAAGKPIIPD